MSHIYSYVCPLVYSSYVAAIPQTCKQNEAEIQETQKLIACWAGIIRKQGDSSFSLNTRIQIEFSPLGLQWREGLVYAWCWCSPERERESERGGSRWVAGLWAEESCCLSLWFVKHNRGRRGANGKIPHQWSEEVYMGVCVKVCVRVYKLCQISLH